MGGSHSQEELDSQLWVACECGDDAAVKQLLRHQANPNAPDQNLNTALHKAARYGSVSVIKQLISHKSTNINAVNANGNTSAMVACRKKHIDVLKALVEAGADINMSNSKSQTLLHIAAKSGDVATVKFLLEHGANLYTPNCFGMTPLHTAILFVHTDAVREILKYKPNVNALSLDPVREAAPTYPSGPKMTPLFLAVQKRSIDTIQLLLLAHANPNIPSARGWTPLHLAVLLGFEDVVTLLLSHVTVNGNSTTQEVANDEDFVELIAVKLDVTDDDGNTPLHYAVQRQSVKMIEQLLNAGANSNICNRQGQLPLHLYEGSLPICELLIRGHSAVDIVAVGADEQKQTALLIACAKPEQQAIELAQMLMNAGASVNTASKNGITPLHVSVATGSVELTNILLSAGANANCSASSDVQCPLLLAVHQSDAMVDLLLRFGADPNMEGHKPDVTCIYLATVLRNANILRSLLAREVNETQLKWVSPDGMTAFQAAVASGDATIGSIFLESFPSLAREMLQSQTETHRPTILLAVESGSLECVRLLLQWARVKGAEIIELADSDGLTALHVSAASGKLEILRLILNSGANPNVLNKSGKSPFVLAVEAGQMEAALCLAQWEQFDVQSTSPDGNTPLHISAASGCTQVVQCLLQRGANPNAIVTAGNITGSTPLISACLGSRNIQVVKALVSAGADVEQKVVVDGTSMSPLLIAVLTEATELLDFLLLNAHASLNTLPEDMQSAVSVYLNQLLMNKSTGSPPPSSPPRVFSQLPLSKALVVATSFSAPTSPTDSPRNSMVPSPASETVADTVVSSFQPAHRRGPSRTLSGSFEGSVLSELTFDRDKTEVEPEQPESAGSTPRKSDNGSDIGDLEFNDVIIHSSEDDLSVSAGSSAVSPAALSDEE